MYSNIGYLLCTLNPFSLFNVSETALIKDFFYPMRSVAASDRAGADLAWTFYQENFEVLLQKLAGASPSLMDAVIQVNNIGTVLLYCYRYEGIRRKRMNDIM